MDAKDIVSSNPRTPRLGLVWRVGVAGVGLWAGGFAFSALLSTRTPFELLVDPVTRILPAPLFAALVDTLGYWAKPLLLVGLSAAWAGLGAAVAALILGQTEPPTRFSTVMRSAWAAIVVWLIGSGLIASLTSAGAFGLRIDGGPLRFNGALVLSAAAFALFLRLMMTPPVPRTTAATFPDEWPPKTTDRRAFLGQAAWGALAVAGAVVLSRRMGSLLANAGAAALGRGQGTLVPEVTPNDRFYVVSKNIVDPSVDPASWRLTVDGRVQSPLTLTLDEFKALPSARRHVTLACISNEVGGDLISNTLWTGIPLRDVLRMAGLEPDVGYVASYAADDYNESLPLDRALQEDVLLAYEMNGEPLSRKHGAPVRLLIPGRYGMKSTKWLVRLEARTDYRPGYWEQRGWDETASVNTMSRIDTPADLARIPLDSGPVTVGGVAYAGTRGIRAVEVSFNDGAAWEPAQVRPALSTDAWRLWTVTWTPHIPGNVHILVRATDGSGALQSATKAGTFPSGAAGYHSIHVRIIEPSAAQ